MPTVVLVRHGETTWNRERRVQGWAPTELTAAGREQAAAMGEHLAATYDVDRVVSSDLDRALETARHVRRALAAADCSSADAGSSSPPTANSAAPELDRSAAWRERDFGALQGLSYDELFSRFPEYAVLDAGHQAATARPTGGERWVDARARTLRAVDELVASQADDATAVVVTHGGPIRHVLATLLELDVAETIVELEPTNCSVTELRVEESIELPPAPDDGGYEPAFPSVTTIERRSECAFLEQPAEADD